MNFTKRFSSTIFTILILVMLTSKQPVQASNQANSNQSHTPQIIYNTYTDGEAFNYWGSLSCWHPDGGSCSITSSPEYYAHNWTWPGSISYAIIAAGTGSGWSDIGRSFRTFKELTNGAPLTCTAWVYVKSNQWPSLVSVHGQIDIIDPSGWTYIATVPFFYSSQTTWGQIKSGQWSPPGNTVFVRVGVTNATSARDQLSLDDLTVECKWNS